MDLIWVRRLFQVLVWVSCIVVVWVVFSKRNKIKYDEAAKSIIDDHDMPSDTASSSNENGA